MAIAVYNSFPTPPPIVLPANMPEKIVGIQLNSGNNQSPVWTVFGKVVVNNPTGSPATVTAHLKVEAPPAPPTVIDASQATIPANGLGSISLEGVAVAPTPETPMCVEIICTCTPTPLPHANAEDARLIAISVDRAAVVLC